jgi:hypothetical protein
MFKNFSRFSSGLLLVSIFLLAGCKNDKSNLGLEIQPPYDKLNVLSVDTATIVAYSQIVDSVKTDETSVSMIGSLVDPVFGQSTAGVYTQLRLSKTAQDFGITPFPDSLVLKLDYDGFYGDSNAVMTFKVFELAEKILIDTAYYSNQSVEIKTTLLAQKTFTPDFRSDVIIGEDTLDPHLRISLTDITASLAMKLLNSPSDSMSTNTSFLNYFYGLYITAEPATSGGAIIYFDLLSSLSEMVLYYHNAEDDSLSFQYVINSNCGRFMHFDHDYSLGNAAFKSQVVEKDSALGQNVCYIQALGGVKTFIRFPYLPNFYNNGKIAVNEARLFLKCMEADPQLDVAVQLVMVKKNEEGSYDVLDDQLEGIGYFGGYYDKNINGYWFRITAAVQDMMRANDPDYGYEIYLSGGSVNAERVILTGTDPLAPVSSEDRMKLVITYTTMN